MNLRALFLLLAVSCGGVTTPGTSHGTDGGGGGGGGTSEGECFCICAPGDSGCESFTCSFDFAGMTGTAAGCPTGDVCSAYGDLCTPRCGDDGGCATGMQAIHLVP